MLWQWWLVGMWREMLRGLSWAPCCLVLHRPGLTSRSPLPGSNILESEIYNCYWACPILFALNNWMFGLVFFYVVILEGFLLGPWSSSCDYEVLGPAWWLIKSFITIFTIFHSFIGFPLACELCFLNWALLMLLVGFLFLFCFVAVFLLYG